MNRIRSKMSSTWGATLVICVTIVVSSAVSATAAKLITGKQIKNSTITGVDIKNGSIGPKDLSSAAKLSGPTGPAGPTGAASAGASAAAPGMGRAYALVNSTVVEFTNGIVRGFTAVRRDSIGTYCLAIDPSTGIADNAIAPIATIDWYHSTGGDPGILNVLAQPSACNVNEIEVKTFLSSGGALSDNFGFSIFIP